MGEVVHTCNISYSRGRGRRIKNSRPGQVQVTHAYNLSYLGSKDQKDRGIEDSAGK
jgi:hypothetical protein